MPQLASYKKHNRTTVRLFQEYTFALDQPANSNIYPILIKEAFIIKENIEVFISTSAPYCLW